MTQIAEFGTPPLTRGRQIKFTPERIQQIKNLVERGKSREDIAELIGVTVGSLQVTCSRLGISLRRPTLTISLQRVKPLAFLAAFRNVTIGELIGELIAALLNKDRPVVETAAVPFRASPSRACGQL